MYGSFRYEGIVEATFHGVVGLRVFAFVCAVAHRLVKDRLPGSEDIGWISE